MTRTITPHWRLVWITGASSGIGEALSLVLAAEGSTVAASARSQDGLSRLAEKAADLPGRIVPYPLDVTDASAVQSCLEFIEAEEGPIDLAIMNAGTYRRNEAGQFSAEDVRHHIEVNVLGAVHVLDALLPRFKARRRGHLAVTASVSGYRGLPHAVAYGAGKAALINMCEALKAELHGSGVGISVINPGFVKTPLTDRNDFPMPFIVSANEAARTIVSGLKKKRFEIAFPKRLVLPLKLGRMLPYWLYFKITRRMVRR